MAQITAALVKTLREETGAGMMDCKKALQEVDGELEAAKQLLRERGLGKAQRKAGRETRDGRIGASVSEDARRAALVEINCETDFVAKTDDFQALALEIAAVARDHAPADVDALLELGVGSGSVRERVVDAIAKLGENIQVSRVAHLEAGDDGRIGSYVHAGGKIATLVQVRADDPSKAGLAQAVHNFCMHVAATSPLGVSRDDIDASEVESERAVLAKQAESEGKPAQIIEKMVEGRIAKFFKEVVLLEQALVMDPDHTVEQSAKEVGAQVVAFRRFELGEASGA